MLDTTSIQWTVLAGVSVAVIGLILNQTLKFYFFDRISKYYEIREKIAYSVGFHSNVYWDEKSPSTDTEAQNACDDLRGLGFRIVAFINERHFLLALSRIPSHIQLSKAARGLVGLSNSLGRNDTESRKRNERVIFEALGLKGLRDFPNI